MERKYASRARLRIKVAGEARLDSGGLISEWKRFAPSWQTIRQALRIFLGLNLDPGQSETLLLCFEHSYGPTIQVEHVVSEAVPILQGEIAEGDATRSVNISFFS